MKNSPSSLGEEGYGLKGKGKSIGLFSEVKLDSANPYYTTMLTPTSQASLSTVLMRRRTKNRKTPNSKSSPITLSLYTLEIRISSYRVSSRRILAPSNSLKMYFFAIQLFSSLRNCSSVKPAAPPTTRSLLRFS